MEIAKKSSVAPVEPEEIDIKELFRTVGRYKWSILFITLIFLVGASVYAYFAPNVYKATTTMKISTEMAKNAGGDFMSAALGGGNVNLDDEFALMKSRFLAQKALDDLDIGTRYFTIEHYKKKELYKDSPFVISAEFIDPVFYGHEIQLLPVDQSHFRLYTKPTLKEKIYYKIYKYFNLPVQPLIDYDQIHEYGKKISTPWFVINIQKVYDLKDQVYSFSIVPNKNMYGFIQGGIDAAPISNFGSIVEVSFQDTVPMRAKDIVEAIVNAYNEEKIRLKTESANRTLNFIDSQLKAIHQTLKKSASKLQSFKATHVVMDIGAKAGTTTAKLSELEAKVYEINTQINILDNLLNYIKSNKDIKGLDVSSAQLVGPVISNLIVKLQEAASLRSTLLVDFTELHPDVIKVTEQINRLKSMLIESIKSTLNGLKIRKSSLIKLINESKAALRALPKEEQQLAQLTRDFMVNEKIYSFLLQKRAETAIVEASKVSEIQILDPALVPGSPIKPKRSQIVLIGLLIGLVLGLLQAFVRKLLDNSIKSVEDIEKLTSLPVYGVVPDIKSKKMKSAYLESLRVIRTNLEFLGIGNKSKVVTVTSSIPQEGKTTTTVELSKIIAKSGKRVIVLDLDMRRSKLHELLKMPNKEGMSTLLAGKVGLKEAIQHSREENLDVITSGPMPPNPSELLMSDAFKRVIATLRNEYDYVMLDSPPIGLVADAMIVMRMSDINLIVLRANYSKKDFLKNINRFVEEHELKAGIVLNGVKTEARSGAYGFGYGYNYGYSNNYYS
ncbi:GumC family protein [Hydrogenimonas cancrithermarum]|uniref:non-specific protein-tyrosine kinase n=1 Tax=Hydrogenimonas cancrithermarum TaxID=2993563 RepID=A0ABN6WX08_9BACT|nr:polysaccharide biosynthesis tyrosine autokinase [Hydrogenimonas cancrithermarum]BDY13528.1 tyrosine protein kinase [Hydrogenimonas cancrithermarum]